MELPGLETIIHGEGRRKLASYVQDGTVDVATMSELRSIVQRAGHRSAFLDLRYEDDAVQHRVEVVDSPLAAWMSTLQRRDFGAFIKIRPPRTYRGVIDDGLWRVRRSVGHDYDTRVVVENKSPAVFKSHAKLISDMAKDNGGTGSALHLHRNGESGHRAIIAKASQL